MQSDVPPTFKNCATAERPEVLFRVCHHRRYRRRKGVFARQGVDSAESLERNSDYYLEKHSEWSSRVQGPFISTTSEPSHALRLYDMYDDRLDDSDDIRILRISGHITQDARSVIDLVAATDADWDGLGKRLAASEYLFLWHIPPSSIEEIEIDELSHIIRQRKRAKAAAAKTANQDAERKT